MKFDKSVLPFTTVAMAEILLDQDELAAASEVIGLLKREKPADKRVHELMLRLQRKKRSGEAVQMELEPEGVDRISLGYDNAVVVEWELTPKGLDVAKQKVRYSGRSVVRFFTAASGPRGVRTSVRDLDIEHNCAAMKISGTPGRAVHTAAVGFLGNNGQFVPMASALPVSTL